jgi:hypothetical protein
MLGVYVNNCDTFTYMKSPLFYPKLFLQKNLSNHVIKTKRQKLLQLLSLMVYYLLIARSIN